MASHQDRLHRLHCRKQLPIRLVIPLLLSNRPRQWVVNLRVVNRDWNTGLARFSFTIGLGTRQGLIRRTLAPSVIELVVLGIHNNRFVRIKYRILRHNLLILVRIHGAFAGSDGKAR